MSETSSTLRLYYIPQSFPCGPQSSCCGPVGQSDEELRNYMIQLESSLPGVKVHTIDMSQKLNLGRDLHAVKLLNTFGAAACPIFMIDREVVSMGPPSIPELVQLLRAKLEAHSHGHEGASPRGTL